MIAPRPIVPTARTANWRCTCWCALLWLLPAWHDVQAADPFFFIQLTDPQFGPDYFAFRSGPLLGIVLNSSLIRAGNGAKQEADAQKKWLQTELEKRGESDEIRHVIVFQHHPWFVERVDEPDAYHNLPLPERTPWLNLLRQAGVTHVFAGHTHANSVAKYESLEMVVSCAIGKPLQKDGSGLRIVIVRDSGIEHRYYHLGEIPNQIDVASPPAK